MTEPLDRQYPDPDLVRGYVSPKPKPVKTFHVAAENPAETLCGLPLGDFVEVTAELEKGKRKPLVDAGWARGLLRQGLDLCDKCEAAGALAVPEAPESPQDDGADDPGLTPPDAG